MRSSIGLAAALCLAIAGSQAGAQSFPNKPVRIVIGFPPGGAIDIIARVMAPKMSADLGQTVVIDNRPGAGGIIGMQQVARSPADGYTVFMGTMGNFSITPGLVKDLPYNVQKDFSPVKQVASAAFVIYSNPTLPFRTVPELLAYARANPHAMNFSSSGNGGLPHVAGEMFNLATGIKMTHVPYKGSAPSINDVEAGQVQLTFEAVAAGLPAAKGGRLRALATTGAKRLDVLPDVPTVAETVPGFVVTNWFGVAVPAGTPSDRIDRLQKSFADALKQADVVKTLTGLGVDPVDDTPAEFASYVRSETERWQKVIDQAGIKLV